MLGALRACDRTGAGRRAHAAAAGMALGRAGRAIQMVANERLYKPLNVGGDELPTTGAIARAICGREDTVLATSLADELFLPQAFVARSTQTWSARSRNSSRFASIASKPS